MRTDASQEDVAAAAQGIVKLAQRGRLPRRSARTATVLALIVGMLVAMGATRAAASTNVTAVTGSALGYHSFGITLFGGAQADVGPTPTESLASNASNSPQSATATTGLVQYGPATIYTSDGISLSSSGSLGATGSETTTSSVNDINKATTQPSTGSEALTADNMSGSCSASASATSGSTTVTNGTLLTDNGDATHPPVSVPVPANPAPNTTISGIVRLSSTSTDHFHYVFNEQTTNGSGVLTVNPVDEYFDGPTLKGNLIVGQVVCGVTAVSLTPQTITYTSTPPSSAVVGGPTYTVTATGGGSGNPVVFTIDSTASSVCSISGPTVSFTAAGTCVIDANQAGNASFDPAPQVQQSFAVGKGSQAITFTSVPPSNATPGGPTYNVTATGGVSGNPVTFTIDASATSVCSISSATVSFTAAGACVIDANQAGDANYNAAPQAQQSVTVGKGSQTITFTSTAPANATVAGPTYAVAATASSGLAVSFTIDSTATSVCSVSGATVSFSAVGTCVIDANQAGNANFNAAPQVQQSFAVGKGSQTITFTSTPPSNPTSGGPTYTVAATASSGLPVSFTIDASASSVCSISGATVSFNASGMCVIDANQAGNANFNAASQAQQSFAVGAANQTITFTSSAPTGAVVGGATYTATATASSGLPVSFSIDAVATSVCTISGATVNFTAVGTCVVDANQAGDANFNPAPQVQQTFAVARGSQAITFTSAGPTGAVVGGPTYSVTATGGASGNAVTFTIDSTSTSVCSISGSTVSFTAAGTCAVDANQAGSANYNAAPQSQQSFAVGKGSQAITFTSTKPSNAVVAGPPYTVTATGGASGNAVTFSIDSTATSVCSISGATVTFTAAGSCVIDANQAGSANYNAAPQVQQSFAVGKGSQTISFTSTAPASAAVGGATYTATATASSGLPVSFTIDATATSVCSISGATVSFTAAGTCVIDANQSGNANFNAAPQAQQSFAVGKGSQTITFTSTAPAHPMPGGPTYTVTATASSGLPVSFTIDSSASSVCSISGATVSFTTAGTCVIDGNQAGSANFNAAPQVQQSFTVQATSQTITYTSTAPTGALVGGPTYTVTATASSGLPVSITIDSSASSICSISGATVSFTAAGTCVIDANQAGNSSFAPAPQVQQSFAVGKGTQAITFTSTAPSNATPGGPAYTVTATGGASGNAVTFTIDSSATSVCSISGATVSFTAAGTCVIDANQAGNANYNAAPQAQQSFAVGKASQAITFTSTKPANAVVAGPTYTVTATGGGSGNPVTFTIDSTATSVCSISGATVSFTAAGTCVIDANQAGNANFNAAPQAQQSFAVGKGSQTISYTSTAPSNATPGGPSYTVTATASSGLPVTFTIDASATSVCSISGATVSFTAAGMCVIDANQAGNANFNAAPQAQQSFAVGAANQTITYTSTAPTAAAVGGPSYTVTAIASSGLPVSFTIDASATSVCALSGSTVSFTAAGTCVIDANQAGNASFNPAPQVQQTFAVGKGSQAITFTSTAPSGAVVGGANYTVTATGGPSGNAVTFTIDSSATSVCGISGSTVSFSAAGTCVVDANQAGNANYNAAPRVQQSFAVGKGAQAITYTSTAPSGAMVGGATYTVTATASSGLTVSFTIDSTSTSVCAISGATVSFTTAGPCVIDANQAGNANFNAAPQVQQSFAVGKGSQTIMFTSTKPANAAVAGPTYAVTAAGGGSSNPVTFTIDASATSVCSISGATVSFTAAGTCAIDANQAGDANFNAAPQAQQSFAVGKGSQTIGFTSTAPSNATPGGPTYTVTATASSGLPVSFTIDATASSVCSISGSTVSFTAAGTCVIDANQAGNANYNAAPQAQQSFGVGKAAQTITFTSTAPSGAVVGGATYTVTATASSGLAVAFTIDSTATAVCSISGSTVSFASAGTCVVDANQPGNASFNAAPQVQQSFAVGKGSQTIAFTSMAPSGAVVGGSNYTVTATGGASGNAVAFTIDATASSVCTISGSTVSFAAAGTCVIDANQAGNADYNAAPQAQQSFAVGKGAQAITFTSTPPSNPMPGGPTYNVTATGGASGNSVTFTIDASATSVCAITGSTVSFTAAGTCVIDANQAGNVNYNAAPQAQQSFGVGASSQTITYTSTAPTGAVVAGPTYSVTATASSGLTVLFTIDASATSVCSIAAATVSFNTAGTCVIDANQAGNSNFMPAPQVQQSFAVGKGAQVITYTSTTPTGAVVGGATYTVTATGGASGSPVTFTIDSTAASVCSIAASTVSFTGAGTCLIDANQAGNANYNAATQAQQSFAVGKGAQTITFTSKAPMKAAAGGSTYTVTATASSGLPVTFSIDPSATSVCSISGSTVTFIAAGMCVIDANQPGDANFSAALQAQQSFAVAKARTHHH